MRISIVNNHNSSRLASVRLPRHCQPLIHDSTDFRLQPCWRLPCNYQKHYQSVERLLEDKLHTVHCYIDLLDICAAL